MYRQAVGAVIIIDGKFLLVHKIFMSDGLQGGENIKPEWDFIKGGIKNNENIEDSLKRELKEEINITNIKKIIKLPDFEFKFPQNIVEKLGFYNQKTYMYLVFINIDENNLKVDGREIDKFNLFPHKDVREILSHNSSKQYFNSIKDKIDEYVKK